MIATSSTISQVDSVAQAIGGYTSWLSKSGKADRTIIQAYRVLTAIFDVMGLESIDQFDADITQQFLEHQARHGYSGRTIATQLSELKRFAKWLVSSRLFQSDPIASVFWHLDEDDQAEAVDRAQERFQRLFRIMEYVSSCRFGASHDDIYRACNDVTSVCLRTITRDTKLLASVGILRKEEHTGTERIVYKANPFNRILQLAIK